MPVAAMIGIVQVDFLGNAKIQEIQIKNVHDFHFWMLHYAENGTVPS